MHNLLDRIRTTDRRIIAAILIVVFLVLMTCHMLIETSKYTDGQIRLMVTTHQERRDEAKEKDPIPIDPPIEERYAAHRTQYPLAMAFLILAFIGTSQWNWRKGANLQTYLNCLFLLAGIGCSYKMMFAHFFGIKGEAGFLVISFFAAVIVYNLWRHMHQQLSTPWFCVFSGIIVVLLVWTVFFGVTLNGNEGWINVGITLVQPSEFIKGLLIILGAASMHNPVRSTVYSVLCLASCAVMVKISDLGAACVLLALFLLMTYIVFDKKRYAVILIILGVITVYYVAQTTEYVQERLAGYLHAMDNPESYQQRDFIVTIIHAGWLGLGVANATPFTSLFAAETDASIAGIQAVYGLPMLVVVMACYVCLVLCLATNRGVDATCHPVLFQLALVICVQVVLNYWGSLDLLPFTGVTSPLISTGGSSTLTMAALFGAAAANMCPNVRNLSAKKEEETYGF